MKAANPPRRHHFAPVFYLKRWAGTDGKLEQFSRPGGAEVKARRLPPTATGYADDLYAMPGLEPHLVQQVEQKFMQQVDDQAADVLAMLEAGGPIKWTTANRSAWSRFLQSTRLRTPADILGIKAAAERDWGQTIPEIQAQYDAIKKTDDPATLEEFFVKREPRIVENVAMVIATKLIDNPKIGEHINGMQWEVMRLESNLDLLTSDRSLEQVKGLGDAGAFITLPIGPHCLFVAANKRETLKIIRGLAPREIARVRNGYTVRGAAEFVWGRNRGDTKFIRENMSAATIKSAGERLGGLSS